MNRSAIINFNKNKLLDFFKTNKAVIMLTLMFVIGVGIGCLTFAKSDISAAFGEKVFNFFLTNRQSRGFIKIFAYSFKVRFVALLLCFLCGASLMGIFFNPMLTCLLGFLYGVLSAYAYNTYLLKGIAFNALVLIPTGIVFVVAIIFGSCKSVYFSFEFAKLTFPNSRSTNLFLTFKEYCGYYLIYLSTVLASSIIDALLSKSLISYFEFL